MASGVVMLTILAQLLRKKNEPSENFFQFKWESMQDYVTPQFIVNCCKINYSYDKKNISYTICNDLISMPKSLTYVLFALGELE